MKKHIIIPALALCAALSLCACGAQDHSGSAEDEKITVAATTYPVYKLAETVLGGNENYTLELVVDQQISCLHDYTLSVNDMRTLESADIIIINGAGLEEFLDDVLETLDASVIDCSAGIELLPYAGHEDHNHGHGHDAEDHGHYDPHIWMDPWRMQQMLCNIADAIAAMDSDFHAPSQITMPAAHIEENAQEWKALFDALPAEKKNLITFHDGFAYLADAYGLNILKSIEEESGSEASAKDIKEIVALIRAYDIPMIFVEENGSDATAKAIQRETGVAIGTLSTLMSKNDAGFWESMDHNMKVLYEGLSGEALSADAE